MINTVLASPLSQFLFMGLSASSTSCFSLGAGSLSSCAVALMSGEHYYQVMMFVVVLMEGGVSVDVTGNGR